jgi:hypothetical protein
MKRAFKIVIIIFGIFAIIVAMLLGILWYKMHYKVSVVDTIQSSDGNYELILQSVGEPYWPFGAAPGRLVLKSGETVVTRTSFEIANDGTSFSERAWSVTWYDDYVEIILSGSEQLDELVTLYYDGQVEHSRLTTHYGVESESTSDNIVEDTTDTEDDSEIELFPDEWQITAGYQAIYEIHSDNSIDNFEVYYGASESSTRCVLSENENKIEYLVYIGKSENEKCGLYVHYQSNKNIDGTWSYANGTIVDIYAYVYENGDIVNSGKTNWNDVGSEAYQEITGEK